MANKVKFGLSQVHYAVITDESTMEYETPVKIPGAVNLSLSAEGESNTFHADNIAYFTTSTNNGFSGDLEVALLPDKFYQDVLGYKVDSVTGALIEVANAKTKPIALMFQFEGDQEARKTVLYKVVCGRNAINHSTVAGSTEPQTDTIPITAHPTMINGELITRATVSPSSSKYETFYTEVLKPTLAG